MAGKDLEWLFLVHRREIHAYLTRTLRDAELAADLTQETFLRFAEQGRGQERGQGLAILNDRSYLFRMARNLAIDHMRKRLRQRTDPTAQERLAEIAEDRPTPDSAVQAREDVQRLQRIVLELPERTRRIFILVRVEGLTYAQAAARLDISESAVQKHLADALGHVVLRLKRDRP